MKTTWRGATLVAGVCMTLLSNAGVAAQNDQGLMALVQREMERSGAMFEQLFGAMLRHEDAEPMEEGVRVILLDVTDEESAATLREDERLLACDVALKRLEEQRMVQEETERIHSRLRSSFRNALGMMNVQLLDETRCEDLEQPLLVDECNRVVAMDDEIAKFLSQGKTKQEICELVKKPETKAQDPPLTCKLCKRFVQMLDQAIEQDLAQVEQVRAIIGDICDSMSADSMCHTFIKRFDDIVAWLRHGTDPSVVCARVSMCTEEAAKTVTVSDPVKDCKCVRCSHTIGYIRFVYEHKESDLDKVHKWFDKKCTAGTKCEVYAKNFDQIVTWIKDGKHPRDICVQLKICTSQLGDASSVLAIAASDEFVEQVSAAVLPYHSVDLTDGKTCFYCDYFTTVLQIIMQEAPDQVDEIRDYADIICGMLGDGNVCHQYVDKLDYVVDALKSGKKPRPICAEMKFCAAKQEGLKLTKSSLSTVTYDGMCVHCSHGVGIIQFVYQHAPNYFASVDEWLQMFCTVGSKCEVFAKNFDQIIAWLKLGKQPRDICVALKLCMPQLAGDKSIFAIASSDDYVEQVSTAVLPFHPFPMESTDDKTCFYCDYFTTMLEIIMQEAPAQVDQIREYADMICGMLGDDNLCHKYVDKLDYVMDAIKSGKKPRPICTELKFCVAKAIAAPSTDVVDVAEFKAMLMRAVDDSVLSVDDCFFCTQVATVLKIVIAQQPDKLNEIRWITEMVCKMMPATSKCHPFVADMDKIIDSLKKGEEPASICHDMQFCPKANAVELFSGSGMKSNTCAYCSGLVTVLQFALSQKPDEVNEVRQAAGIVCELLPADDKCHDDLKMFDTAVAALKSGKQPHEICHDFKFCDTFEKDLPLGMSDMKFLDPSLSPSKCTTCKQNSLLLAAMAMKSNSLETFHQEITSICRLIPQSDECDLLMAHHDLIVNALAENEDVDAICERIGACSSSFEVSKESAEEASMSMGCLFCETTAELLVRAPSDQSVVRLAKEALGAMCFILPPSARCDVLSSKFDALDQLLQQGKSPSEACHAISLCDAAFVEPPTQKMQSLASTTAPKGQIGDIVEIQ
ncbi:hypothetical protein Poli38472_005795 [Pythium oligandrum]|uniref:Saposin B-type domain-containing protein n=1 Tax=Pythium oligandrum TaxID=41045 RepID=A0A8K1FQU7_PYTOL|nr:hypothetical protein Poli38472_005795 [Pythium oligandrum]|eukprot:TMW68327.1 hypothetical protein Poli38472_005795 [Pythium oligandrum]